MLTRFTVGQNRVSAQNEGISRFVDGEFDKAFNLTMHENDLPNVRWGRIDYMNVTALTTKWVVWRYVFLRRTVVN